MNRFRLLFASALMLIALNACQNEEVPAGTDELSLSQQETQAEEILTDIDLLADEALDLNQGTLRSASIDSSVFLNDCPTVTVDETASPQTMTIDFGTSCTGKDGKVRSGQIIVTSTSFNTFPSVRTKTFDQFVVSGKEVEGSIVQTISQDHENNVRTAVIQENITITDGEGSVQRIANTTRRYRRNQPASRRDNVVISWGTVVLIRASGVILTKTTTPATPLVFKVSCHQIVRGIVSFATNNGRSWTIDYGNGDCDRKATLTNGEKTKVINLR